MLRLNLYLVVAPAFECRPPDMFRLDGRGPLIDDQNAIDVEARARVGQQMEGVRAAASGQ